MPPSDVEPGKTIICQELNTGKGYSGFFCHDDKSITAEICSYDDDFHFEPGQPIFLRTENNDIVSLHANLDPSEGSAVRASEPQMVTFKKHIISNTAVIGHHRWQEGDRLKRVTFEVKYAEELLRHSQKIKKIARRKFDDTALFTVSVNGMTIRAGYGARYSPAAEKGVDIRTLIDIEFDAGATLSDYLEYVTCLVEFFSLSLGTYMTPSNIRICRLSHDEMLAAVKAHTYPGDYAVEYVWREVPVEERDLWLGGSLVMALDNRELTALRNCIVAWVDRHAEWRKANAMMMGSLRSKQEMSADRLLAACKWFEEIPLTHAQAAITDDHIQLIAETAAEKAAQLGYPHLNPRIIGAIKPIKTETHEQRFSRLLTTITKKFGQPVLEADGLSYLKRALEFRGKSAHGHFSPADDTEFREFAKSVYAMEALCFLLTAYDLPINAAGHKRSLSNPFITSYRLM